MTTKEQERKALAQIKKIVEGLGNDSYVATAFEGCFEIAEENIENDFACSMKQRAESAEKKADALEDELKRAMEKIGSLIETREVWHKTSLLHIAALEDEVKEAKSKALDPWLYEKIWMHYTNEIEEHKERLEELADQMADHAEHPESVAFRNTVAAYRTRKESKEICEQVVTGLELIKPVGV